MYARHVKRVLIVLKDLPREINHHHPSEIQHVSSFHTHRYGRHSTPISAHSRPVLSVSHNCTFQSPTENIRTSTGLRHVPCDLSYLCIG
jgi:hypothetical protein